MTEEERLIMETDWELLLKVRQEHKTVLDHDEKGFHLFIDDSLIFSHESPLITIVEGFKKFIDDLRTTDTGT
jgi:hypothetical protein